MESILNQIREDMEVRGPDGSRIGTVEFVHFGDEDPSTPEAESPTVSPAVRRDPTIMDIVVEAFRTDDVPEELREKLLRNGFVRVDASGLFAADRYVLPDQIASVSDDQITLTVGRDELIRR
jgi:hypothetical protein